MTKVLFAIVALGMFLSVANSFALKNEPLQVTRPIEIQGADDFNVQPALKATQAELLPQDTITCISDVDGIKYNCTSTLSF